MGGDVLRKFPPPRPSADPPHHSLRSRGEGSRLDVTVDSSPLRGNEPHDGSSDTPTIVIAKQNNAFQVFALDDAAARSGLAIGMTLANARAICPHVQVYDADEAADEHALNAIAEWCDRFTPLVALDSPHGLFLDITGCAHLFGGEAAMMQLLCGILTAQGFAVSAAIAGTAVCARTLTRHARYANCANPPSPWTPTGRNGRLSARLRPLGSCRVSVDGLARPMLRGIEKLGFKFSLTMAVTI